MESFTKLASEVQTQVDIIDGYLTLHNLEQPSFAPDSPAELPDNADVQRARLRLIEKASALASLAIGAADHLRWQSLIDKYDDVVLHFLARYNIFDAVPRNEAISYADISKKVNLGEHRLRRIMSMAYTKHYFCTPKPGFVAHTSNSAVMIGDPLARAWILHNTEEVLPWYSTKVVDASLKWPDDTDPKHTGPNVNAEPGEEKLFYQIMEEDDQGEWDKVKGKGWRLARLYESDKFWGTGGAVKGMTLLRAFDWGKVGKAKVVDVGGITGYLSSLVALANPELTIIVQERNQPWIENQFNDQLPAELKGRVTYMPHDKYSEQPVKGADIYLMSTVLHKETDEKAIRILRRIVEAMDPEKSRIVTRDVVMDGGDPLPHDAVCNGGVVNGGKGNEAGLGPTGAITRLNIGVDLQMMSVLNSYQRTREEWVTLFKKADPRFVLKACIQTLGTCASVMEWVLE